MMNMKIVGGAIGLLLLLGFMLPPLVKLQEPALIVVILIGLAMAAYEYVENVRSKDD